MNPPFFLKLIFIDLTYELWTRRILMKGVFDMERKRYDKAFKEQVVLI